MTYRYLIIGCLLSAIISAVVTQHFFQVTKTVETTKEITRTDVQTVVHTVTSPSGVIDTTTTIIDHTQKTDTAKKSATVAVIPPNWLVSGSYETDIHTLQPVYGIQANRRILGPVFIGALLNTKGMVGLSVGMEF